MHLIYEHEHHKNCAKSCLFHERFWSCPQTNQNTCLTVNEMRKCYNGTGLGLQGHRAGAITVQGWGYNDTGLGLPYPLEASSPARAVCGGGRVCCLLLLLLMLLLLLLLFAAEPLLY